MGKRVKVDLLLPRDLKADLERRISGTGFALEDYINSLLMVQVVQMICTEREDRRRWEERNAQLDARASEGKSDA